MGKKGLGNETIGTSLIVIVLSIHSFTAAVISLFVSELTINNPTDSHDKPLGSAWMTDAFVA